MSDYLPKVRNNICAECPWARGSAPGWTGPASPDTWASTASTDQVILCHMTMTEIRDGKAVMTNPDLRQCAGAAQFRTNIYKSPRNPTIATAEERTTEKVFATSAEFYEHHQAVYAKRHAPPTTRVPCPYCGKRVALTTTGKLHAHNRSDGQRCIRKSPN